MMMQAPVVRQEAHEIPLDKIEAELTRLWREADASTLSSGGQVVARNSVMTLVAYAQGMDQAQRVARAIESLTGQHPSRAIILAVVPDAPSAALTANVAIITYAAPLGGVVRAEQIMIQVRGAVTHHISGIVLPLLLTEMPVFVWWTGEMPTGDLVGNLIEASDRVIIDTADCRDPERDLVRLADMIESRRQLQINRPAFGDFNWSRLKSWRELTAQFFDATPLRPYLDGIERVEIEYAAGQGQRPNRIQAYLYAGWLASRLRWQTWTGMHSTSGTSRIGMRTYLGAPITVEIAPRTGVPISDWWAMSGTEWPAQPDLLYQDNGATGQLTQAPAKAVGIGALMRINIQSRIGGKAATFTILRDDDLSNATTVVVAEGESMPQRRTPLDVYGEAALLHLQLANFDHDRVYEDAILEAKQILASDGSRAGRMR